MVEEDLELLKKAVAFNTIQLNRLIAYIIPEKEDKSKCTISARLSTSCEQPSNHGRIGKLPRSRKGCFKKKCRHKGGCTNNAVEINNYCSIHQDDAC